jgi:hypothetical protein
MANWIDCRLDVLATDPKEINDIANALLEPSRELVVWATGTRPPDDAEIERLRKFFAFQTIRDIYGNPNTARLFENSYKFNFQGLIDGHPYRVSLAFPNAIFLLHYWDMQLGWAWKEVMRNGVVERSVSDCDQPAQAVEWVLLDIFAPFRTEYQNGQPFGSMWSRWVDDLVAAAEGLRNSLRLAE